MNKHFAYLCLGFVGISNVAFGKAAPLVSIPTHDAFFNSIKAHCGKAFQGKVSKDNVGNTFGDAELVMHIRKCTDSEIQIPFHVGDDASRTWILTKTGAGLMLKHDHRNKDGSFHSSTMYGGHTVDEGYAQVQSFPADAYSKALFIESGIAASTDNVWQMMIYPNRFSYRLIRPAREVQVDFDTTLPVPPPSVPWGYE
ncbi:hypothetical protein BM526_13325 [Alteromonas mediterranea]|uniref:hypothetical protein n=1 Tax=Alteromonas mediterranea TaxID=314275 RepID=UPI000904413E|nr:hypothetical protein [Alteromonas mediterranea]APE02748.1 hypothetical protein BM526_13325 [Alteromonas mediterranea]